MKKNDVVDRKGKIFWRGCWKTLVFLSAGIIGGYLLLVLVFALPVGRMHNNVIKSGAAFSYDYTFLIHDDITTKTDDFTDALMLMTAENGEDRNPFTAAIYGYYSGRGGLRPNEVITNLEHTENKPIQYGRYWHGYLLFLKPLLMFFNYDEIMVITAIMVIALIIAVVYLLQKKKLAKLIIPYGITVALMSPITISLSLQYMGVFTIFNLSLMCILLFYERIQKAKGFFYLFLIIGMVTCYFDLLTYPVVTLGIPLTVWLIMRNREKVLSFWKNLKLIIGGAIAWGIGYGGIWVGKWTLGSIITGRNLFVDAMGAAEERMSTTTVGEISRFKPILEAFHYTFTKPVLVILAVTIIVVIGLLIWKKIKFDKKKAMENLWMFVIAAIPLAWYMFMTNHSSWHMFFTYRTLGVFTFAVMCYVVIVLEKNTKLAAKNKVNPKRGK